MVIWIAVILVVILTALYFMQRGNKKIPIDHTEEPIEILEQQLAKGEITEEEFDRRKEKLKND